MGRPKRCAKRPSPYISYSEHGVTTTTTTTEPQFPFDDYIVIPESGSSCPTVTTTTTTTTTPIPLVDECNTYSFQGNRYLVKFICCDEPIGYGSIEGLYKYAFFCGPTTINVGSGVIPEIIGICGDSVSMHFNSLSSQVNSSNTWIEMQ